MKMVVRSEEVVVAGFGIRSVGTLSFAFELENATGPIPLTKRTKSLNIRTVYIWYRFNSRQGQKVFLLFAASRPALRPTKQQPRYLSNLCAMNGFTISPCKVRVSYRSRPVTAVGVDPIPNLF